MSRSHYRHVVGDYEIFRDFGDSVIDEVRGASELRSLKPGEVLIEPGIPNTSVYLLLNEKLEIILEKDGSEFSIPISPGECLGEMSLILEKPTSALARATEDSDVFVIPGDIFWHNIATSRQGIKNLMAVMAQRLWRTNDALTLIPFQVLCGSLSYP